MIMPCNCPTIVHCSCLHQQSSNITVEDPPFKTLLNPCTVVKMENQSALINDVKSDDPEKIDNADVQHEGNKTPVQESGKKLSEMTMDEYLAFKTQAKVFSRTEYRNTYQTRNLTELLNNVKSNDPELQLKAFSVFRKVLTGLDAPTWQKIIESKILKRIVHFLDQDALPQLQFEALGIISKLVKHSTYITILMDHGAVPGLVDILNFPIEITVDNGAVPGLVDLLNSPIEMIRALAITTLANIAKASVKLCELVVRNVALEPLLPEFSTGSNVQDASWVLRLFCYWKPQLTTDTVKQLLMVIEKNLDSRNEEILVDTCWTLVSLCEVDTCRRQVVINRRVCRKLIELLYHESPLIVEPALETVAKFTGDQMEIEHIIDFGMVPHLLRILLTKYDNNMKNGACKKISNYDNNMKKNVCKTASEFDKNMKKNACMTISSIANTGGNQIQDIVGYGVTYVLADMFEISDMDLKMEVARTISFVTLNCTNEALRCVGEKCVKPLWDMLDCSDKALISKCIGGLIRILKAWESNTENVTVLLKRIKQVHGLKKIQNLVNDDDIVVSDTAKEILRMFWPMY